MLKRMLFCWVIVIVLLFVIVNCSLLCGNTNQLQHWSVYSESSRVLFLEYIHQKLQHCRWRFLHLQLKKELVQPALGAWVGQWLLCFGICFFTLFWQGFIYPQAERKKKEQYMYPQQYECGKNSYCFRGP